ncbi:glycoside hydrolase family 97 catalytic domain-containing protein [Arthrobacter sp. NPDC058127]|uniref:glycoside hydrolase family 97 catalytic domain-containing protein n=1 Tax=Arthrobacter sp. NPDC058127 TaxID=3346351 RepID=UPI0036E3698C
MATLQRTALATVAALVLSMGVLAAAQPAAALTTHTVTSPDGQTSLTVLNENDGTLTYSVVQGGIAVVNASKMGVVTAAADLSTGLSFGSETNTQVNQNYTLVEHFDGPITSSANEMRLTYTRGGAQLAVVVRAQNDGVAFRYEVSGVGLTNITREATTIALPVDTGLWPSDYRGPKDYEDKYSYVSAMSMGTRHFAMPTLASLANNAKWALISESAVYVNPTYPATRLDAQGDSNRTLKVQLPGPDGDVFDTSVAGTQVPTIGAFVTPWRTIVVGSSLDTIVNSSLITDLNPAPAAGTDTSWVRPGKALWSWWSNEEKAADGDDMVRSQKEYIDTAEQLNMQYITVDCCYNNTDGSIEQIAAYGKKRGIGVFIWQNKGDYTNSDGSYFSQAQLDTAMQAVANRGVAGVKIDFMQSDRLETMALYDRIAKAALNAKVLVNFHGSTKPAGENRTYPNLITSEAVLGNEQYKYGRPPTAVDTATYPFTRNAVGGMDMTPVIFSNSNLLTTQAHQLAQSVVFSSAMQHFADSAAAYETWVGRQLLSALPTVWDESHVVEGFPGNYATIARRSGADWFIGSVSDAARTTNIPLSFLGSGTYTATLFEDGENDRQIVTETRTVTSSSTLAIPVRAHGGLAVHISATPLSFDGANDLVLEAESTGNTLSGGASVATCPGCSGGSKVGNLGNGATVRFNGLQAPAAGTYVLRIGYLSEDPRAFTVSVNGGTPQTINAPRSGKGNNGNPSGWDIVRDVEVPVTLAAGANTVTIGGSSYAPDIDRIIVLRSYEAESANNTLTGNASVTACTGAECSGQKVGNLYGASTLVFNGVQAQSAGSTTVQIRYASASPRSVQISTNGGAPITVTFPATSDWNDISTQTVHLPLNVGTNTITFDSAGGYSPDIDRIIVRQSGAPESQFQLGATWNDAAGATLQARGTGFFQVGSTYYMVGEDKTAGATFTAVACYSSPDLKTWTRQADALTQGQQGNPDLAAGRIIERPKVIYNDTTAKYVMYVHIDNATYSDARVGVATSDTPCGPYTYIGSTRPLGNQSRDIGLFKDTDGKAYLLSEDRANGTRIDSLSDDYLSVVAPVAVLKDDNGNPLESPALVKVNGRYFILSSQLTGWATNDNQYASATSLAGPWSSYTKFATDRSDTYDSQTSSILTVQGSATTSYIYVGDRWNPNDLNSSVPIWLPLNISGTQVSLSYFDRWSINTPTGIVTASQPSGLTAQLRGNASGRCVDMPQNREGTRPMLWDCNGQTNQQWTRTSSGELRTYGESRCLAVEGTAVAGAYVNLANCTGQTAQQWTLGADQTVRHNASGLCLDAKDGGGANGNPLILWDCNGSAWQKWAE